MDEDVVLTAEQRKNLAKRAVHELQLKAEAGRPHSAELAEVIEVCVRDTAPRHLKTLKRLLEQRALEDPSAEQHRTKTKGNDKIH